MIPSEFLTILPPVIVVAWAILLLAQENAPAEQGEGPTK